MLQIGGMRMFCKSIFCRALGVLLLGVMGIHLIGCVTSTEINEGDGVIMTEEPPLVDQVKVDH